MSEPARVAPARVDRYLVAVSGWMLLSMVALGIAGEVLPGFPDWLIGVVAWLAAVPLWRRLGRRQQLLVIVMIALGAAGIAWGIAHGQSGLIVKALTMNTMIIAMLVGVAFLPLVSMREQAGAQVGDPPLRRGRIALARTIVGVHLFGSVINLTAALIAGDRLRRQPAPGDASPGYAVPAGGTLTRQQAMALGTSFSISAFWSPFLGAMAVALTVAKGASLLTLVLMGLPLAAIGVLVLWLWLSSARFDHAREFEGYPINVGALWIPLTLAIGVFAVHEWRPQWSVLTVISALAIAISALALAARDGLRPAAARLRGHVPSRLPGLAGELWIFMAAAVLAAGLSALLTGFDIGAPFTRFGGIEASLVLVICTVVAWLGLHTIVTIPLIGVWLAPLSPDPNLLACAFLCSWALGLPACATSGTVLSMHARYGIPVGTYIRWNLPYLATMLAVSIAALNLYAYYGVG
jgi:hypothetical protein